LSERVIKLEVKVEKKQLQDFLAKQDLTLDQDVEYAIALFDGEKIVAAGCFGGRVLKCIAVDGEYKNRGLSARIVTALIREEYQRARTHLFIYTKPINKPIFSELGFYTLAEVPSKVVLLENRADGIKKYLEEITADKKNGEKSAAIIVNCNPFTRGHQYLIEYAATRCQRLHVFVVWEDRSIFPAEIRYRLVKEGVQHLPNVAVHLGKDYIISDATFPSYFIKEYQEQVETHARLDLEIFSQYIVPALRITKRFVGEEPYCQVTAAYNRIMQEVLPGRGVMVEVVPRLMFGGRAISASRVRELIRMDKISEIKELVPETTYKFLLSLEAREIISHIQSTNQRH
jgi:[citrate (pro-3S)-lyase] ligase